MSKVPNKKTREAMRELEGVNNNEAIEERILELNEGGLEWLDMIELDEYGLRNHIKEYKALRHFEIADWLSELVSRRADEARFSKETYRMCLDMPGSMCECGIGFFPTDLKCEKCGQPWIPIEPMNEPAPDVSDVSDGPIDCWKEGPLGTRYLGRYNSLSDAIENDKEQL